MTFWEYAGEHTGLVIFTVSLLAVLLVVAILIGFNFEKDGKKLKGSIGCTKKVSQDELLRNTLLLSSAINTWQINLSKKITKISNEVVGSLIRTSSAKIDNNINSIKIIYGNKLLETKKELTQNDNYETIIFGFVVDQVRENFKDQICSIIREDHFESKTKEEINTIIDNAINSSSVILNQNSILDKKIINSIENEYKSKLRNMAEEIINLSADKYKELEKNILNIKNTETENFKKDIKIKFPILNEEAIESIIA